MLGFLRGIEKGVAREGAAQRQHHSTVLSNKENHLDRLLNQIRYNREHQLRVNADTRAAEVHDFNYGDDGYMHLRRGLFKSQAEDYPEDRELDRRYKEAQIFNLTRPRATTGRGGGPTWSQTRDITIENLAPTVLKHLKREGESAVWPWDKRAQFWPPGFQADRPFVSEDPNEWTQTKGLRQAGAHLVEELILRGVDPNTAMQMVPVYWDQILDSKGSDVLKRLNRTSQAAGYDNLELRKIYRDTVYEGAMNYMRFKQPNRPAGAATDDADKLLDSITIE